MVIGQQNEIKKADISETRPFDLSQKVSVGEASTSSGGKPRFVDLRYIHFVGNKLEKCQNVCMYRCVDFEQCNNGLVWFGLVSVNQQA